MKSSNRLSVPSFISNLNQESRNILIKNYHVLCGLLISYDGTSQHWLKITKMKPGQRVPHTLCPGRMYNIKRSANYHHWARTTSVENVSWEAMWVDPTHMGGGFNFKYES